MDRSLKKKNNPESVVYWFHVTAPNKRILQRFGSVPDVPACAAAGASYAWCVVMRGVVLLELKTNKQDFVQEVTACKLWMLHYRKGWKPEWMTEDFWKGRKSCSQHEFPQVVLFFFFFNRRLYKIWIRCSMTWWFLKTLRLQCCRNEHELKLMPFKM